MQDREFGYDDTYLDLVVALQKQGQKERSFTAFKHSQEHLEDMFEGRIEYDEKAENWIYKKGNSKFSIHMTAEGVKKLVFSIRF